ncbi:hypothetical protein Fcan01_18869, partial [Folsomia candida]
ISSSEPPLIPSSSSSSSTSSNPCASLRTNLQPQTTASSISSTSSALSTSSISSAFSTSSTTSASSISSTFSAPSTSSTFSISSALSTSSTFSTSSTEEEPDMAQVMTTLRVLSQATLSRRQQFPSTSSSTSSSSSVTCPNCHQSVNVTPGQQALSNREAIMENLRQLEAQLRSRGVALPAWVQAYRAGDTIKAAKLLHLSYTAGGRSALQRPRASHVLQEATSTTTSEQETSSTSAREVSEDRNLESSSDESNKRIRLNSDFSASK